MFVIAEYITFGSYKIFNLQSSKQTHKFPIIYWRKRLKQKGPKKMLMNAIFHGTTTQVKKKTRKNFFPHFLIFSISSNEIVLNMYER